MSNKVSSQLHDLILSLSKSEKRYFKVISSKHILGEENKYMTLFDYLESIPKYDETRLRAHFKGEAFLNKFSITKARLYDNILRALEQFHADKSVDSQLFSLLNSVDILFKKSLYTQARKVLRSAEKLAQKNERYGLLLEISFREKKLVENSNYSGIELVEIRAIWKEDETKMSKLSNYLKLWNVKSELFYLINRQNRARNNVELIALKEKMDCISNIPDSAHFFDSEYLKNHIHSAYYFYVGEFRKSLDFLEMNIRLFQLNKHKIEGDPNVYFSILVNTIYIANKINERALYHQTLVELKTFPETYKITLTEDMEIKMFSSSNSLELSLYIGSGEFDKALVLIPAIEEGLEKYGSKINQVRKAFLNFQMAYAYFGIGHYKKSLKFINEILNADSPEIKELLAFSNLFNLILHYELENARLLPYTLKSVERFYEKQENLNEFETLFLSYFKRIIKKESTLDRKVLFYDLNEDLKKVDSQEKRVPLEYFRFDFWIASKATNLNFSSFFNR